MKKLLLLALLASAATSQAQLLTPDHSQSRAEDYYAFTYANFNSVSRCGAYGDENVDYRVCIFLNQPELVGYKIYGLKVYGYLDKSSQYSTEGLKDFKVWMSDAVANVTPTITQKDITMTSGVTDVWFDEPYEITSKGVAVGYDFSRIPKDQVSSSLWSITSMPVPFSSPKGQENSFFWTAGKSNFASFADLYGSSLLTVYMKKDGVTSNCFKVNRVYGKAMFNPGDPMNVNFMVTNTGNNPINNIGYSYTINGETRQGEYKFAKPFNVNAGLETKITLNLGTLNEGGLYDCTLDITKVNGEDNTCPDHVFTFPIKIKSNAPDPDYSVEFSYDDNSKTKYMGINRKTVYYTALKLQNPAFTGMKVVGAEVSGLLSAGITNYQMWMANELGKDPNLNIDCIDGEVVGDKMRVFFDFPTTLTDDGLYIGYNLTVDQLDATNGYPIPYFETAEKIPNSLFLRNGDGDWYDYSENFGPATIKVFLEGDVFDNGAVFGKIKGSTIYEIDAPVFVNLEIINKGTKPIENISYSYVLDSDPRAEAYMQTSITGIPGTTAVIDFPLPELTSKGQHNLSISIDKVNGVDNTVDGHEKDVTLCVPLFNAPKRPIMEEFTGLWCGWCPRGWMAMKLMNERDSNFIGAAYHYNDAMQVTNDFPVLVSSYPGASIDRGDIIDPFYGSYNPEQLGIEKNYKAAAKNRGYAQLDAQCVWSDDSTKLTVTGTATFGAMENGQYELGMVLIENGLFNADGEWKQVNYYGTNPGSAIGLLEPLATMGHMIGDKFYCDDMVYDDVVINADYASGINGSIPEKIQLDTPYSVERTFDMTKIISFTDYNLVQDRNKVQVIIVLITPEGKVGNAIKVNATGNQSGIVPQLADPSLAPCQYFDLMGRRVNNPSNGIFIKKQGNKTTKIAL